MYLFSVCYRTIGLVGRVVANVLGDRDSNPGHFIPKTQKLVLDAALLSTQNHKVQIKGPMEQSNKWSTRTLV